MTKVTKQHYVWRNYLKPWSIGESIWTHFKENGKCQKTNLMNVAQMRYFYKVETLTRDELSFVESFISASSSDGLRLFNKDFLVGYALIGEIEKQLSQIVEESEGKAIAQSKLKDFEISFLDDMHGKMETFGFKLLACTNIQELKILGNSTDIYTTIQFLCFQYFRTKNMRDLIQNAASAKSATIDIKKCWGPISFILANNVAETLSIKRNTQFILLENKTHIPFVTADQPIFNLAKEQKDDAGHVKHLDLYYPLSPKTALRVNLYQQQTEKYSSKVVTEAEVEFYNNKMFENSAFFVFADNKELLENLK